MGDFLITEGGGWFSSGFPHIRHRRLLSHFRRKKNDSVPQRISETLIGKKSGFSLLNLSSSKGQNSCENESLELEFQMMD